MLCYTPISYTVRALHWYLTWVGGDTVRAYGEILDECEGGCEGVGTRFAVRFETSPSGWQQKSHCGELGNADMVCSRTWYEWCGRRGRGRSGGRL